MALNVVFPYALLPALPPSCPSLAYTWREAEVATEEVNNTRIFEPKRCVIVIFGSRLEGTCGQYSVNDLQHVDAVLSKQCGSEKNIRKS